MAPTPVRFAAQSITLLFLAGSVLLLFFIVLAGSQDHGVLHKWYFLAADTSSIEGAEYPISRWSMYGLCGFEKGESVKKPGNFIGCTKNKADYPLDPKRNFNISKDDIWEQFKSDKFYFETRFQFPFYLIALFFDVVAMFSAIVSSCSRIAAIITTIGMAFAAVFSIIAASLSTAAYVDGRNAFHHHNIEAEIAPTLYGFAWAVVFMALVNLILVIFVYPKKSEDSYRVKSGKTSGPVGGFKFGAKKNKTTVVDDKDASSFVRG